MDKWKERARRGEMREPETSSDSGNEEEALKEEKRTFEEKS
jgi:hypothetical protein